MSPAPPPSLDHLILFTPTAALPPAFTSFTPTPGGTHADNLTANTLVLLSDGCYIELIHFLPSAPSSSVTTHWWGPTRFGAGQGGWRDWCLTTSGSASENHAQRGESHASPIKGARERKDGVRVEWEVTFPKGERGGQANRGRLPFYCHDVTPRGLRVPLGEEATGHQCGALGVGSISVVVRDREMWEETRSVYEGIFGQGEVQGEEAVFSACRVVDVEGLGGAKVVLRVADQGEEGKVAERGFWVGDVVLAARAGEGKQKGSKERLDGGEGDSVGGLWVEYV